MTLMYPRAKMAMEAIHAAENNNNYQTELIVFISGFPSLPF